MYTASDLRIAEFAAYRLRVAACRYVDGVESPLYLSERRLQLTVNDVEVNQQRHHVAQMIHPAQLGVVYVSLDALTNTVRAAQQNNPLASPFDRLKLLLK